MSTQAKRIVILGGGTFSDVRLHEALATRGFGGTARKLTGLIKDELQRLNLDEQYTVETVLTKMADHTSNLVTSADVGECLDALIADPSVKVIVMNAAVADFNGQIGDVPSGKYATRLKTSEGPQIMVMTPAEKLIGRIRKDRKDIFAVGFKTTDAKTSDEQYRAGLELLKKNSLNLVLANNPVPGRRNNMIVAPEETRYCETEDRGEVLAFLSKMIVSRMQNHFTRSTVVDGEAVPWSSEIVPASLREVVDHCIRQGAYKPVLGRTAGHFAVKVGAEEALTSIRKSDFRRLSETGLVRIEWEGNDRVIAHGFRPSVGGQSQRSVFEDHAEEGLDCIVHFHCPVREDAADKTLIPVVDQWPQECGSHECGRNTSRGLRQVDLGDGDRLSVVMLDSHGPNIVFNRRTPPEKVIKFIERNFDLQGKTGGLAGQDADA